MASTFTQASQRGFDGKMTYRWYVYLYGKRKPLVTWAKTRAEAMTKRGQAFRVTPAPPISIIVELS